MRTASTRFRPLTFSALTFLLVLLGYVVPSDPPLLTQLELASYDLRLVFESRFRPVPRSDRITMVGIEDHSLENYGRWPWPRSYIAEILDVLTELGASEIFMDIGFPESEEPSAGGDLTGWAFGEQVMQKVGAVRTGAREIATTGFGEGEAVSGPIGEKMVRLLDGVLEQLELQIRQWLPRSPDERFAESLALAKQSGVRTTGVFTLLESEMKQADPVQAGLRERLLEVLDRRVKDRRKVELHWFREELPDDLKTYALDHWTEVRRDYFEKFAREAIASSRGQPRLEDPFAFHAWVVSEFEYLESGSAFRIIDAEFSRHLITSRHAIQVDPGSQPGRIPIARTMTPPVPLLAAYLHSAGADNRFNDVDGKLRACPLVWKLGETYLPSGALTLMMHQMNGNPTLAFEPGPVLTLRSEAGDVARIPLRPDGAMPIHWAGLYRANFPEIAAGTILDYAARKRQRELYFLERSKSGEYGYILHLRNIAQRRIFFQPGVATSLLELDRLSSETWGKAPVGLADLIAVWGTKVTPPGAHALELTTLQDPKEWYRYCDAMRLAWENGFFEAYRRRLARYEKEEDPAKKAKQIARLQEEYGELDRLVREVADVAERLRQRIGGKICFLGSTASSSTDLSPTPFEPIAPNVGMYANVLNTYLNRRFIQRPGILSWDLGGPVDWEYLQLPILVAVCLIVPWVLLHLTARAGLLWMSSFMLAWTGFAMALFAWRSIWLDMASPLAACVVGYIAVYTWNYFRTEHVKAVFASYVDPRIVEVVVESDEMWKRLGGVQQNITPFFSDIAGFTTISELLAPEELSGMLTDYLSPMTEIIHENDGTLDKYIGDAIVAFFGSPRINEDHPYQACCAAIEQQRLLVELRARWEKERRGWYARLRDHGMEISFRVGLNTGNAKVGNFGSAKSRNYTMIGDTVNLAARLEGANKEYGTRIMASEATYLGCHGHVVFRDLDRLQVKGKTVPVKVYEVVGLPGELEPWWDHLIPVYTEGLRRYHARDFAGARAKFEEALVIQPADGPSQLYVARCRDYEAVPPADGWDGSFTMTHK